MPTHAGPVMKTKLTPAIPVWDAMNAPTVSGEQIIRLPCVLTVTHKERIEPLKANANAAGISVTICPAAYALKNQTAKIMNFSALTELVMIVPKQVIFPQPKKTASSALIVIRRAIHAADVLTCNLHQMPTKKTATVAPTPLLWAANVIHANPIKLGLHPKKIVHVVRTAFSVRTTSITCAIYHARQERFIH